MSLVAMLALAGYFVLLFLLSQGACPPRGIKQALLRWRKEAIVRCRAYLVLKKQTGFTLIELSIVLVVIGLIVGGVLVGQDMIRAAGVRAQISQIEKYNTAVDTFHGKYGALPGDLNQQVASTFGFQPRGTNPGQGDGNGLIQGYNSNGLQGLSLSGEIAMFWVDLSTAQIIDQTFNTANATAYGFADNMSLYQPVAAIGQNNYVGVWSAGQNGLGGKNLFSLETSSYGLGLTVAQAYTIDSKVDDGVASTGNVQALYNGGGQCNWAGGMNNYCTGPGAYFGFLPTATSCMDNHDVTGGPFYYSMSESPNNVNCALSFKMQAGD